MAAGKAFNKGMTALCAELLVKIPGDEALESLRQDVLREHGWSVLHGATRAVTLVNINRKVSARHPPCVYFARRACATATRDAYAYAARSY